ncbi:MAG: hypothetical protein ACOZQL_10445 [Myxococcota bacterium]
MPSIGRTDEESAEKVPYRGTTVSYGHQLTAYNYTQETVAWSQRLGLMPEWHFTNDFYVRSRFFLFQEFTKSDTTKYLNEVELSDLWLDAVWAGWREPVTKIRVGADLRFTFPTSKTSQAISRLFTIGPSVNVSRAFGPLALSYSSRFTGRINRYLTSQNAGGLIINCGVQVDACIDSTTGRRNIVFDIIHGPTVSFTPHPRFNIAAIFLLQHGFLPPLAPAPEQYANVPELQVDSGPTRRDFNAFILSATWTPHDIVSISAGTFTFQNQLGSNGQYIFPLFNRNTVVSLDVSIDLEATVSSLTKEKK